MGALLDLLLLLLCTVLAALWMRAWVGRHGGARWTAALLFSFALLAFAFSATSPDDDLVQQVFATRVARVGRHHGAAVRKPLDRSPFLARTAAPAPRPAPRESSVIPAGDAVPKGTATALPSIHAPPTL